MTNYIVVFVYVFDNCGLCLFVTSYSKHYYYYYLQARELLVAVTGHVPPQTKKHICSEERQYTLIKMV